MRSKVKTTMLSDPVLSLLLNDEGYKLSGSDRWKDNDASSLTDVF